MESEPAKIVAALHDVVEDTSVTLDDLREHGFSDEIVKAIRALTKRPGETLDESIARVRLVPLAAQVKRADIADNSDPSRLRLLPEPTQARLRKKYGRSLALLDTTPVGTPDATTAPTEESK